jgi:hypothetical protein
MGGMGRWKMKKIIILISVLVLTLNTLGGCGKDDGCIQGDCKNGQGTRTTPDGLRYVGEFKDGEFNGQGILTFPDGSKYVGKFKKGKFHGQGTVIFSSREKYEGEFRDGKSYGQGIFIFPDGKKYVGELGKGGYVSK